MDYRDKLHKNKGFLTTPLCVAFLAAGLMMLSYPVPALAAASTIEEEAVLWQRQSRRLYMERQK